MHARILTRYSPRPGETKATAQQVEIITDWCRREGHDIVQVYSDEAKSGKVPEFDTLEDLSEHRPALLSLLRDLQPGELAVAYDLKRWSRDPGLGLCIAKQIRRKKAHFATTVNGIMDLDDANSELVAYIEWWSARNERKQIAARCRTSARIKQANGYMTGGKVRFGYREVEPEMVDGKLRRRFVKDPDEQAVIARMRELDARGYSTTAIANTLKYDGVRGRSGPISRQLVAKILARGGSLARSPG